MTLSLSAWNLIRSMKSVDQWSNTINANITGSLRTGFKSNSIEFGNGVTQVVRPDNISAGIQIAEQQVSVSHTRTDWRQGDLVLTKQDRDYGIQGQGLFILTEKVPAAPIAGSPQKLLYTRDGQFHDDGAGHLRTNNGLYVVGRADAITMGIFAGSAPPALTTYDSPEYFVLSQPATLDQLTYSKYGSTIFENILSSNTNTVDVSNNTLAGATNDFGSLKRTYLEASNVNIDKQAAELSASNKYFDSLTKQFLVYISNIDASLGLFR